MAKGGNVCWDAWRGVRRLWMGWDDCDGGRFWEVYKMGMF